MREETAAGEGADLQAEGCLEAAGEASAADATAMEAMVAAPLVARACIGAS
tara:strand:- start:289 stop:441 length:153 start_codon:yes stop_codon:yes gene_type:complete